MSMSKYASKDDYEKASSPATSPRWNEIDALCEGRSKIDLAEIILRERATRSEMATTRPTCTLPEFIGKTEGYVGNEHHHAEVRKHWDSLVEEYSTTEFRNTYNAGGAVWNDAVNLACGIKRYLDRNAILRECAKICDDLDDKGEYGEAAAACRRAIESRIA